MNSSNQNLFSNARNNFPSVISSILNINVLTTQIPDFKNSNSYFAHSSMIALINNESYISKYFQKSKHALSSIYFKLKSSKIGEVLDINLLVPFFCGFVAAMTIIAFVTLFI